MGLSQPTSAGDLGHLAKRLQQNLTMSEPRRHILVVDDSAVDRSLVVGLLGHYTHWSVESVDNGCEALRVCRERLPDLIVTDLQMPEMDGLALVCEVKRHWPNLPVILITGKGSERIAVEALRAGAANYSPKSALAQDLPRTIEYVLGVSAQASLPPLASRLRAPFQHGFVLENDCSLIGPVLEHLQSRMPDWSENDRVRIGMALGEALVNAMHHGNLQVSSELRDGDAPTYHEVVCHRRTLPPYCQRRVHVLAEFDDERIKVCIEDEGPGFNPATVPDPTIAENLDKLSGRGLLLIKTFMDEVHYNERGNCVTLIKRRETMGLSPSACCGCGD
ncbi:MAG TPA: ATP-binding protein [Pirellulaceae bacterium]|nr:ATP-binding protein [Pirellulaceae bacterium]